MSRSPDRRRGADGFTLIEIVVALGITMVVVTALLPQLIVGIRATTTARAVTQAKGVVQGQLDRMRNLPYHVSPAAGDYRDVLDYYYRDLATGASPTCMSGGKFATPQAGWAGYVAASGTRCSYEPAGPLYRSIIDVPATTGGTGFTLVVDTQFLAGNTPPQVVTPPSGYNTQTTGKDSPASPQIGVTITALYDVRGTVHPISTYTQISDQPISTTRTRAEADATTLEVGSVTTSNGAVSFAAGRLNLIGSLTYASTVAGNLSGTAAGLATGEQVSGASKSVTAPPSVAASSSTGLPGALSAGCPIACWGATRVDWGDVSSDQGLPIAGSQTSPMQALVIGAESKGVSFGNGTVDTYRPGLKLTPPLVQVDPNATPMSSGVAPGCAPGGAATPSYVTASGYLRSTPATDAISPSTVESCVVATSSSISLFPTEFAPRGVVRVELHRANARCLVSGSAHSATVTSDYEAVVYYFDGTSYQVAATVTPANGNADPLDSVNVATTAVGGGKVLGDYIASWSSLLPDERIKTQTTGLAAMELPGVVTIASQPVRTDPDPLVTTGAPDSVVSLTLGALSCSALDQR